MARNVDIKLQFAEYDGTPGLGARTFRKNLILTLSSTDDHGYSLADCLLRCDQGACTRGTGVTDANGVPVARVAAPGAPVMPAGAGPLLKAQRARQKRLKDSAAAVCLHFSDALAKDAFLEPPYRGNGPEIFDQIMEDCNTPLKTSEINAQREKVRTLSIVYDVGKTENSVQDLLKLARSENALLDPGDRVSEHEIAEMILNAIAMSSSYLAEGATDELDAVAGPAGTPGVRLYQTFPTPAVVAAAVAAGVAPPAPTRNLRLIVSTYHAKWQAGYRSRAIAGAPKQNRPSASGPCRA